MSASITPSSSEVFHDANVDAGLPFRAAIERAMSSADATVVIVSDHQSDFIAKEVETARRLSLPISPMVGASPGRRIWTTSQR